MRTQKMPTVPGAPDNEIRPGWKRELSEWLLVVATMAIATWVFLNLVPLVFTFVL